MIVMGNVILAPALPRIAEDLNTSVSDASWIAIAYGLAQPALMPLAGRLSDMFERKDAFLAGLLLLAVGSAMGSLAASVEFLVLARVVQAAGSACIAANAIAIVSDVFPPRQRNMAIGIVVGLIGVGGASGLASGGAMVSQFNWESTFLVPMALSVLLLLFGLLAVPRGLKASSGQPIDWLGAALIAGGMATLLLAITKGLEWGWTSPEILSLFAAAVALGVAFLLAESRAAQPLVDLSLFRNSQFTAINFASMFGFAPLGAFVFLMPFYLQGPQRFSAQESGLIMVAFPVANAVGAAVAGRLPHSQRNISLGAGASLAMTIAGFYLLSRVGAHAEVGDIAWRLALGGLGLGIFQSVATAAIMSSVNTEKRGSASGLLSMFQQTGTNVGIALSGLITTLVVTREFSGLEGATIVTPAHFFQFAGQPDALAGLEDAFMNGFSRTFLAMIAFTAVGMLFVVYRLLRPETSPAALEPEGLALPQQSSPADKGKA